MGDLLRQGCQWLGAMLKQHASSPVTYRRPAAEPGPGAPGVELELSAAIGDPTRNMARDFGLMVESGAQDFLILAADFTPTFGEPQAGDEVEFDGKVFQVMDVAGQGHWRWNGPHGTTMRVHTKEVGVT